MIVDFRVRLPQELRPPTALHPSFEAGYSRVLHLDETYERTAAQLQEDAAGVDVLVVHAEYEYGDIAAGLNEAVARFVTGAMVGFGTVPLDARRVRTMTAEVERAASLGLRGLNLQPAFFDRAIDDRELYPVYARAEELGLVVALHTGVHYARERRLDREQPLRIDRVAVDFPDLQLVACHAAWPWTAELAAVARRHPTVCLDVGAVRPRYIGELDTGWSPLRRLMDTVLRDQVLFATDWPVTSPADSLAEWREQGLRAETWEAFAGGNAQRLLGLSSS